MDEVDDAVVWDMVCGFYDFDYDWELDWGSLTGGFI